MRLLTIDPGNNMGIAIFQNGILLECGLLRLVNTRDLTRALFQICDNIRPDQAVVEMPQIYQGRRQSIDQNDLIHVAKLAGIGIAALSPFCQVEEVLPRTWKGNRPKDVHTQWIKDQLVKVELEILEKARIKKGVEHNVLDAIGIGIWKLRRNRIET